ncbi:MAG: redoxin domain-containing protein [Actinomycetota bacterium]|jgi:thiol-disulfide isomerase/thioredoxin|nr:redoxin domain-containing protein [Actinomycetota bacterium]
MSTTSTRQRAARMTGGARRRAEERRRQRSRRLLGGATALVLALVALAITLHLVNTGSGTASAGGSSGATAASLPVGTAAPDGAFTTLAGGTERVEDLRGKPTLLWFVTTWCSSCEAGTQAMAQNVASFAADGVRVVEVENYADLGQSGPAMGSFAKALAGSAYSNPDWTFGEASPALTHTYNPRADLDIYYLIDGKGTITEVNSAPASTMPQLLSAARGLT